MSGVRALIAADIGAATAAYIDGAIFSVSLLEPSFETDAMAVADLPRFRRTGLYGIDE